MHNIQTFQATHPLIFHQSFIHCRPKQNTMCVIPLSSYNEPYYSVRKFHSYKGQMMSFGK